MRPSPAPQGPAEGETRKDTRKALQYSPAVLPRTDPGGAGVACQGTGMRLRLGSGSEPGPGCTKAAAKAAAGGGGAVGIELRMCAGNPEAALWLAEAARRDIAGAGVVAVRLRSFVTRSAWGGSWRAGAGRAAAPRRQRDTGLRLRSWKRTTGRPRSQEAAERRPPAKAEMAGAERSTAHKEVILKMLAGLLDGGDDAGSPAALPAVEEEGKLGRLAQLLQRDRKAPCKNFFWKTFTSC
ncbi:uncharacterized protein GJ701_014277 isoform 1-T1 [Geothlypis trichas]